MTVNFSSRQCIHPYDSDFILFASFLHKEKRQRRVANAQAKQMLNTHDSDFILITVISFSSQ
jgi:hypothetical protein